MPTLIQVKHPTYITHVSPPDLSGMIPDSVRIIDIPQTIVSWESQGSFRDTFLLPYFEHYAQTAEPHWSASVTNSRGIEYSYGDWWPHNERPHQARLGVDVQQLFHRGRGRSPLRATITYRYVQQEIHLRLVTRNVESSQYLDMRDPAYLDEIMQPYNLAVLTV